MRPIRLAVLLALSTQAVAQTPPSPVRFDPAGHNHAGNENRCDYVESAQEMGFAMDLESYETLSQALKAPMLRAGA